LPLRCVYTDLDGTLLGRYGSLFRDSEGEFSMLQARALEACHRAGVEVVIKSGRREGSVMEDAKLIGSTSYICEVGCLVVMDGERTELVGDLEPDPGKTLAETMVDASVSSRSSSAARSTSRRPMRSWRSADARACA
jgi:hydroxymethylpyrimidine pyrophosphatase-like HAD family hydrolase